MYSIMYNDKLNTGKGNRNRLALTEPYRPSQCRGDLQACSERRQGTDSSEGCRQVGRSHRGIIK